MITANDSNLLILRRRSRQRAALIAVYLGTFLATLDISIVNVALPTLQSALATNIVGMQWVVNAYAICLSAFMLSAGPLGDRYGHKRAWLLGVVLFSVGSVICAVASTLTILLIGRAVQGVAAALLIPGAMTILTHAFTEPKERAHAIGGWSAFTALALILGPILGGLLLHSMGWQSIFYINLPIGIVALVLGAWGITECKYPEQAALDPMGQGLSAVGLGTLSYAMIEAGHTGFWSVRPMISLSISLCVLSLFVIVEIRVKRPLFPIHLFKIRAFAVANIASFALGFSYYASLFFFSIFLQQIQGWSAIEAGWRMMPQFIVTACVSMPFGRLSAFASQRRLMMLGYGLVALSMSSMVLLSAHTPYYLVGLLFALLGLGAGLAVPATGIAVMTAAPVERSGAASSTMNALRQMGMTLGIALLGSLLSMQAVQFLTNSLEQQHSPNALIVANQAITQHHFSGEYLGMKEMYVLAMEHGFHMAMLGAGGICVLALVFLGWDKLKEPQNNKGSSH